jgi:hypothetical protein
MGLWLCAFHFFGEKHNPRCLGWAGQYMISIFLYFNGDVSLQHESGSDRIPQGKSLRARPYTNIFRRRISAMNRTMRCTKQALATLITGFAFSQLVSAQSRKQTVVAGKRYAAAPGGQEWILGRDYRDLWLAPIEVEVLDLQNVAGGLKPVMRVGGRQTLGLAMKGSDGRDYTFRGVDKGVSGIVPEEFQGTGVESIAQDQIAASFPGSDIMVSPLAEAIGVLHVESRLAVMPDDPALGEYQADFAGVLGLFSEYPGAVSDTNPGFHGATEILGHPEIWERLNEGPELRVDTRAYLRARLLDLLLGDWDRHRKQWRWAKIPGKEGLQPIPEDRDQAFSDYEGLALDIARINGVTFLKFEKEYPSIGPLTTNGWDVDRYLLTDVSKTEWMEIARQVQSKITDDVIEDALRRLPPPYYELRSAELRSTLRGRRDELTDEAEEFYRLRAAKVDIYCTAQSERVVIDQIDNRNVEVSVALMDTKGAGAGPYYHRRFNGDETHEVRVYLQGGDDQVETRGQSGGRIKIRLIGGPGDDVVADSPGRSVDFYDFEGRNRIEGRHTSLHRKPYVITGREDEVPEVPPRDWGRFTKPLMLFGYHSDPGLVIGGGFDSRSYGFRKYPWANRHILVAGYGTRVTEPFVDYKGDYRRENTWLHGALHFRASGLDHLRYYGLGNGTTNELPDDKYRIRDFQVTLFPALELTRGAKGGFGLGPIVKYSDSTRTKDDTVLAQEKPYGSGTFGEVGVQAMVRYDGTDPKDVLGGGVRTRLVGAFYPKAWDVEDSFGSLEGEFDGYIPLGDAAQLSLGVGGKKLWGHYPFFEAAYLGGGKIHGFSFNRFAGDASLYGGLNLRWAFIKLRGGAVPTDIGITVGTDVGRMWLDGESSSKWHSGVAGGIFFAPINHVTLFEIGVGKSEEKTFFLVAANLRLVGF